MNKDLQRTIKIFKSVVVHVIPPLLLFYLLYEPGSSATIVVGTGLCAIVIIYSTISLLVKGGRFIYSSRKGKAYQKITLLRPALSILISIVLIFHVQQYKDAAEAYLRQQAEVIQRSCNENNICPTTLDGWDNKKSSVRKTHYIKDTRFFMFYFGKGESFEIHLSYGFDTGYYLQGGVGQELRRMNTPY